MKPSALPNLQGSYAYDLHIALSGCSPDLVTYPVYDYYYLVFALFKTHYIGMHVSV